MKIQTIHGGICAPVGFSAAGVHCGVRKNKTKKDIAKGASGAAVQCMNIMFGMDEEKGLIL